MTNNHNDHVHEEPAQIVIVGAGIVGLVLALAIKKHLGITPEIYEKARAFHDDVGAALGMYPNGLRVIRDIDPCLLQAVRDQGYPYVYRRWEKHDGTKIATAKESVLAEGEEELYSIGIRRWRLQKVLYNAVLAAGIPVHFAKATVDVVERDDDLVEVIFEDGSSRLTELLFGVDGSKSQVRQIFADPSISLEYTGVTCLMGMSECPSERRGIHCPSSTVSKFHASYFPTGENEQCFQIHFPISEEQSHKEDWGTLGIADGKVRFEQIAKHMERDGWAQRYIDPLYKVEHAVRVGFALLNPRLDRWVYGRNRRVILVGDAAHPPVPYSGQGAQLGVEDAGTIVMVIKHLCLDERGHLNLQQNFLQATKLYERLRIPRASTVLDSAIQLGNLQESCCHPENSGTEELLLKGEVMMHNTLSVMFTGASYNYADEIAVALLEEKEKQISQKEREELLSEEKLRIREAMMNLWGGSMPF